MKQDEENKHSFGSRKKMEFFKKEILSQFDKTITLQRIRHLHSVDSSTIRGLKQACFNYIVLFSKTLINCSSF
jgi:hypothetical protein